MSAQDHPREQKRHSSTDDYVDEDNQMNDSEGTAIGHTVEDMPTLYPREMEPHKWRVLSLGEDRNARSYDVNLSDMSCTCPDHKYRKGDSPEVCKHVAICLYHSPRTVSDEVRQTFFERSLSPTPDPANDPADDPTADGEELPPVTDAPTDPADLVPDLEAWVKDEIGGTEGTDIRVQDDNLLLLLDKQEFPSDTLYNGFKETLKEMDGASGHVGFTDDGCNQCAVSEGFGYHFEPGVVADL